MKRFWVRNFYRTPIVFVLMICLLYSMIGLGIHAGDGGIDELVASSHAIPFTVHIALFAMMARRSFRLRAILPLVNIRKTTDDITKELQWCAIVETTLIIFFVYGLFCILNLQTLLNLQLYLIYMSLWFMFFLISEICFLLSAFIQKRLLSGLLMLLPFFLNVIFQIMVMSNLYRWGIV